MIFFSGVAKKYKYEGQSYSHGLDAGFCSSWIVKLHCHCCGRTGSRFKQHGTVQTRNYMQITQCMKQSYSIFFVYSWQVYFSWDDNSPNGVHTKALVQQKKAENILEEKETCWAETQACWCSIASELVGVWGCVVFFFVSASLCVWWGFFCCCSCSVQQNRLEEVASLWPLLETMHMDSWNFLPNVIVVLPLTGIVSTVRLYEALG